MGAMDTTRKLIGRGARKLEFTAWVVFLLVAMILGTCPSNAYADGGRLLATGGVTQLEGAAGGGIVPWAVIGGYGTRDEIGATGFAPTSIRGISIC